MNRKQRRDEKFAPFREPSMFGTTPGRDVAPVPKKPKEKLPELPPLTLKWFTPLWAREDRYRMVRFENGNELIVRPLRPGMTHGLWEILYNNQVVMIRKGEKALFDSLHAACLNAESVAEYKQNGSQP